MSFTVVGFLNLALIIIVPPQTLIPERINRCGQTETLAQILKWKTVPVREQNNQPVERNDLFQDKGNSVNIFLSH